MSHTNLKARMCALLTMMLMIISSLGVLPASAASLSITKSGGWYETAYVEFSGGSGSYSAYYKKTTESDSAYVQADSELIRGTRVDIPGLCGNTSYDIKIVSGSEAVVTTITTMSYDRSGYAHWNYTQGVGAYNDDGTPKSNATIIYVTNDNKDTVTYNGQTGLYNILNKNSTANLIVRFIGSVEVPSGALANDGNQNDGSHMLYLNELDNVTLEGIGYDAHLVRWGFEIKRGLNIEVRNLYFYQYPDDAIGMNGNSSTKSQHIWIHNNDFGIGLNEYAGNGTVDSDKAEGDGSTDIKYSEYVTISYNYYDSCHKTSLVGGGTSHIQDWITYHHNWFNNTESRNPRARNAHIHMFNNYFSGISSYGVGASYNSKIFTEANYFYNCKSPLDAEAIGSDAYSGTIKSYNDVLDNCSGTSYYTAVTSRTDKPTISNTESGGDAYDHFDLDSSLFYYNSYTTQSAAEARQTCITYAGRMDNTDYNAGSEGEVTDPETPGEGGDEDDGEDTPEVISSILDADEVTAGTYSSDVYVNSTFTIKVNAADAVTVDSSSKTSSDSEVTMSQRIKLGGTGSTSNRSIQITAADSGTLTVYMMSSNSSSDRIANLLDSNGNVIQSIEGVTGASLEKYTFTIPSAGTYYLASQSSGINVYYAYLASKSSEEESGDTIIYGDANGDGIVNSIDATIVTRAALNVLTLSDEVKACCDVNGDGVINSIDATIITRYSLKVIDSLPV
ncbi:MAG: hypothetical protein IJO29_08575 [Oscillospiraceae bacterium]|nr:hypothetical protein [Oscillospiraceae bacterium]